MNTFFQRNISLPLKYWLCCTIGLSGILTAAAQQKQDSVKSQKEEDFYTIRTVPIPENIALEVGGMVMLPNDALAVSTRHGEVWIITNPYGKNGEPPHYRLFAQGLHEALGLNYINGDLYLTQRSELTRLHDEDGDGEADVYETVYSWPLSGNYHEYAYGPVLDKDSNMMVNLNLAWVGDHGESLSKWHGWMVKISHDGKLTPFAAGMRSPAGFALNDKGDMFYAENQGDWVGSGSITHVEKGDFLGNPAGLVWSGLPGSTVSLRKEDIPDTNEPKYDVAKRVPHMKSPSVWFPHTILGISTSGILSDENDTNMGPFKGQLFVGDQGQSKIMRVYLEKVKGTYQGIVFPFREGFSSGILRLCWGSDGSMFVGMTARGWGATGGGLYGLQRLEWNGQVPFEMKTVTAQPDGFEITFTRPVDEKTARNAASYKVSTFTYQYHHNYGSPVINQGSCPLKAIEVSPDHRKVRLVLDSLKEGYIHEIRTEGVVSEDHYTLLHGYGYYTLNHIPDGQKLAITAANKVSPEKSDMHMHMHMPAAGAAAPAAVKSVKHLTKQPASWKNAAVTAINLTTKPGLQFDITSLSVKAGAKVKLTFHNSDDMLHNFVLTAPGAANEIGVLASKMGLNGQQASYIPVSAKVLFHTLLLQPKQTDVIYFTAPSKPGDYPYICTYPGHFMVMKGVLKVTP
jgi:azurin/glucose/arabinose dehydrogenase